MLIGYRVKIMLNNKIIIIGEEFPLRRPEVFSQTAILSLLISRQFFLLFNDTDG